jgi:hypothetical protein
LAQNYKKIESVKNKFTTVTDKKVLENNTGEKTFSKWKNKS